MHEKNYSYYTITRIKKEATVLKKEQDYTHKEALDIIAKKKGFKSFKDANNLYENWLKNIIKNELEKNKMIRLTPSENVTIVDRFTAIDNEVKKEININPIQLIKVEHEYNKNNIKFRVSGGFYGDEKTVDAYIEMVFPGIEDFYYVSIYFKDSQNEYHRILRELGITTNKDSQNITNS